MEMQEGEVIVKSLMD